MMARHLTREDSPGFLINQAALALNGRHDRALAVHGVTGAQWTVLWLLAEGRANTPNALAGYLNVDTGAMSRMLARLRAKDLIETRPHADDRRSTIVTRTPRARALHAALRETVATTVARTFSGVGPEELDTFKTVLLTMLENTGAPRDRDAVETERG